MKKAVIINIYNFIRKSHEEPSRFIQDDFDTIRNQIQIARQYGLPTTYALKYDALTDPRYQQLIKVKQMNRMKYPLGGKLRGKCVKKQAFVSAAPQLRNLMNV